MQSVKEKVAYLRGLAEGMNIAADPQGKMTLAIIDALECIANAIDADQVSIAGLQDSVDEINDELDTIEEFLFEDDEDEDDDEDDDFIEVTCPNCNETVYFDSDMLESDNDLICPNCNAVVIPSSEEEDEEEKEDKQD